MAKQKENDSKKSYNVADVCGKLKQLNLEKKKNDDKENIIAGSITIQYGAQADEQVEVKVYKAELTASGGVAKAYEKLESLMSNHVTLDNQTEENQATIVRIYGNGDFTPEVRLNEYHPEDGEYSCRPEVSMGFGNIAVNNSTQENFKGQFDMVVFLAKDPTMEKDSKKEETGRLLVDGYYVTYKNEIKPLSFVVEDEEIVDGMSSLSKNDTIEIWGDIKIAKIVETKEKKSGFGGKAKTDEAVSFVSELIITGGEPVDESDKRYIDPSFVKQGLVERETFLSELAKGSGKSASKKTNGFTAKSNKKDNKIPF